MSALRLRALQLTDVGILAGALPRIEFGDRITLITGPNETGKSTVVAALRAALFENHNARHQLLRELVPHGTRAAPQVRLEFTIDDITCTLHKRFIHSPSAELIITRPGYPDERLRNEEADKRVRDLFEAGPPGRQGARLGDMGVWGLLWVHQDDAAAKDPGSLLDKNAETRGRLQEIIGEQVSQVLGGRTGELIVERVRTELAEHYTEKRDAPTGKFRQAREEVARIEGEIRAIDARMREVQQQADEYTQTEPRLAELESRRTVLQAGLRAAEETARHLQTLGAEVERARERLAAAEAAHQHAAEALAERTRLSEELAGQDTHAARAAEAAAQLHGHLEAHRATLTAAENAHAEAQTARAAAHEAWQAARAALQRARDAARREEAREKLRDARALSERRDALRAERAQALDDATYQRLDQLHTGLSDAERDLRHTGTRLRVGPPDAPLAEWITGQTHRGDLPGLGSATLIPAQPDLAEAQRACEAAAARLQEALRPLSAPDLTTARQHRARRAAREAELTDLFAQLTRANPEGLDALRQAAQESASQRDALDDRLARATAATERQARLRAERDAHPITDAALAELEQLAADLQTQQAARDAAATRVTVRPRGPLTLMRDGAPFPYDEAGHAQLTLTQRTVLGLGDLAELDIEPGGEDLPTRERRLEAARTALADRLTQLGQADLDAARADHRARRESDSALQDTQGQLRAHAKEGLEALQDAACDATARAAAAAERLTRAEALNTRRAGLTAAISADPHTAEALAAAEDADDAQRQASAQLDARAAALTLAEKTWRCAEPTDGEHQGTPWHLTPGRGGAPEHAQRDRLHAELAQALAEVDAKDLETARKRWQHGLTLKGQLTDLEQRLETLAPEGLEALAAAAGPEPDAKEPGDPATRAAALETCQSEETRAEGALNQADADLETARAALDHVRTENNALHQSHSNAQIEARNAQRTADTTRDRLDAARQSRSDEALKELQDQQAKQREALQRALAQAEAAHNHAAPALHEADVTRARSALEQNEQQTQRLRERQAELKAYLHQAGTQGNFDALSDAKAKLEEAKEKEARIARHAQAARRLYEVIEKHYQDAQRRFLAPVINAVETYLPALRPDTKLSMTTDLTVDKVTRGENEEHFNQLSGGTREQLSVIVRLALAEVLAQGHLALPLILDDTLGWSDDARLSRMSKILTAASTRLQLIVLTCHPSRFDQLGGKLIALDELRRRAKPMEA